MPTLTDRYQRTISYVRLSVTDRCDLRCFYCLPKSHCEFAETTHLLNFDEVERIICAFATLGVHRIRITGGEPLLRKGIVSLASRLAKIAGISDLSLSTNALQLEKYASKLKQAGIARINVSLDTLQPDRFKAITNGPLDRVLAGLMAAKTCGFNPIKINMVVMQGINDDEVETMLAFCIDHGFMLRLIEAMPMGAATRHLASHYIDLQLIKQRLQKSFELVPDVVPGGGPARYMKVCGTNVRIGFITPISQHFCATCNRVRLGADGVLYTCLGTDHHTDLAPLLRQNCSDPDLLQAITDTINRKPMQHHFTDQPGNRLMSVTGG